MTHRFEQSVHVFEVQDVPLQLTAITRAGQCAPIVFLHGFGSQIVEHADPDPDAFFNAFIDRALHQPAYASALYSNPIVMWDEISDFIGSA